VHAWPNYRLPKLSQSQFENHVTCCLCLWESVACLWSNFLYTNYSHRPAQTCRRLLAHFLRLLCAPMSQRFERAPTRHDGFYAHLIWLCPDETRWVLCPLSLIVSPRDTWFLRPLNLIASPRDTRVLHPPISLCSTATQCIVSHRYKPGRRLHCEVHVVSHCQFISVNSRKYSTIDCSEQC